MNQTIEFKQETVDKINNCLSESKTGAEMQAYAEAGAKMRETCEHFSSAVLDTFIGEGTSKKQKLDVQREKTLKVLFTGFYIFAFFAGTCVFFSWFLPMMWYGEKFFSGFVLGILLMALLRGLKIWKN